MNNERAMPPLYLFISLACMVLLNLFIPVYLLIPYPWNATGIIPLAMGMALNIIADKALKKTGTTVKPFEVSTVLVTSGAFRFSRNPMYLGMAMILTGVAFLLGSLSPFIIAPIFAITMDRVFIDTEEKMLEEHFGNKWKHYKANVRRWI
jgi:protein-S-isoprenylcysteine O-methyltransferase Ste14